VVVDALYEKCGLGASMSNAEPENLLTVRKTKKEKKNS